MGSGIQEAGLFRSERYEFEQRTSDPSDTSAGEVWLRTDIAPETDQIATLRLDDGGSTVDIPVFDTAATAGSDVADIWRVRVGGTTGFIPTVEQAGTYEQLRIQHNGTYRGAHDALTFSATPDGAIDDFESGDLVVEDQDWSDWSKVQGDTLVAQQSVVLEGGWSGELAASNDDTRWHTTRSSEAQRADFRYEFEISEQNGDSADFHLMRLYGSGADFVQLILRQNGDLNLNGTTVASWSVDTHYRFEVTNIDYSAETFDVEIVDVDASSTVYSDTGVGFNESASGIDEIVVAHRNASTGSTGSTFIDLVGWPPE